MPGFTVCVATTAESALATLRVLGRAYQPGHHRSHHAGAEWCRNLCAKLRQENDWLPVIVLSGMPEAESEYEGLDVVFRVKPVPPPELIELVRTCLK